MNGTCKHPNTSAFTLLEVLIASLLIAFAVAIAVHCLVAGIRVNSETLTQGTVQEQARQCLETMVRELKDSGEGCTGWAVGLNPNPTSQFYNRDVTQVSFSRCTGYDPVLDLLHWGPVVTYSFQAAQGAEPGKLLRREGSSQTPICDHVSDFHVRYLPTTAQFTMTLTLQCPDPDSPGHLIRSSLNQTIKLRNP